MWRCGAASEGLVQSHVALTAQFQLGDPWSSFKCRMVLSTLHAVTYNTFSSLFMFPSDMALTHIEIL